MAPKLIGLAGYARTGKDTVGAYLADQHGYERKAFADKLRELAYELDGVIDIDLHGRYETYVRAVDYLGYEEAKRRYPDLRDYLVALGAGARKVLGPDVWLDALLPADPFWRGGPTVITDVRYINEAQHIVDLGGEVWYITRPGVGPANAEEARSFDEMLVHGPELRELLNWGTIEELHHQVDLTLAHARP